MTKSKGCEQLLRIVQEIFPNQKVILEHNIADSGALFLDIFLPQLMLGFEFDGIQHFVFNKHFHGTPDAFAAAKKRDLAKSLKCQELGITLVRVRYDDELNKELVLQRLNNALDDKDS